MNRRDDNALDELGTISSHLTVLSDLINPEPDLHCVSRGDLAVVLGELEWRLNRVLEELGPRRTAA